MFVLTALLMWSLQLYRFYKFTSISSNKVESAGTTFQKLVCKKIRLKMLQKIPSACCILNPKKFPWHIVPEDDHCVFVPTKYNSNFMQVSSIPTHLNTKDHSKGASRPKTKF